MYPGITRMYRTDVPVQYNYNYDWLRFPTTEFQLNEKNQY